MLLKSYFSDSLIIIGRAEYLHHCITDAYAAPSAQRRQHTLHARRRHLHPLPGRCSQTVVKPIVPRILASEPFPGLGWLRLSFLACRTQSRIRDRQRLCSPRVPLPLSLGVCSASRACHGCIRAAATVVFHRGPRGIKVRKMAKQVIVFVQQTLHRRLRAAELPIERVFRRSCLI